MKAKGLKVEWQPEALLWMVLGLLQFAVVPACGQAGALDASYQPNPSYVVTAVAIQSDGKALIGGGFGTVDGLDRRYLARLNTNGTVDTGFVPATIEGGEVRDLALQPDGKILVGGQFSRVGGSFAIQVARLQTNGTLDMTFNCALSNFAYFRTLALQIDGKVLVASDDGLDRLMPDGSRDTNFQRFSAFQWITNGGGMTSANNSIRSIAELGDGSILVGGEIQAIEGLALGAGVIRLNAEGTWDQSFHSFTNWAVSALLVQPDGQIVVGQNGRLARLNPDGTMDNTFAPQTIEGDVLALARQPDGKILVGGYYQRAAGLLRPGVARFNSDGTLDRNFDAGDVNGFTVTSVALQADKEILIGGYFTSVNGQSRPYVARLHNDDTNYPGRFEFLSISNSVAEAMGNMVIPVSRYAGGAGTATVVVATDWGSALPGADYLSRTQTLVFLPGQTSNYFAVPILDDSLVEGPHGWETFDVRLSAPTGGATLGSETRAVGYILEDDTAIGFASDGVGAEEAAGQAVINVVRLGVATAAVSASFQTVNGTAVAPGDFTARYGSVSFAPGETNQNIIVPLNNDALVEGEETFTVRLSASTGGASLANSTVTVFITDDVSFMALDAGPIVTETDGQATLTVHRWGQTNNTVSVHFATSNLTAQAASDYAATSGTLTLQPGETEGRIIVPIVDDSDVEELEQFEVSLSEPGGTLVLPYGLSSTVYILSEDGAGYPDTRFRPVAPRRVNQLALAPGGKILVRGGLGALQNTLVRFLPDGSGDPSFQPESDFDVYAMAPDANGRVYVVTGDGIDTSVRRLQVDGTTDRIFDPFFVDYTASPPSFPVRAMVVQADGKLIVSAYPGTYYGYETTTNFLNRLNLDGSYDLGFGPVSQFGDERLAGPPDALALQPDGKLVLAASLLAHDGTAHLRVLRLTEAGQLDPTFDAPPELTGAVYAIHPLANGQLLLNGAFTAVSGTPRLGLAILEANGALDPDFVPAFQASNFFRNWVTAAAVQSDGKVVFAGEVHPPGGREIFLGRLNVNGTLDSSFRPANVSGTYVWDLALQADGKVLVGGSAGPFFGAALERLNNDPQVAAGFVEFSAAAPAVDETNAFVTLAVRRVGGTNGLVRVGYTTVDGAAMAANDFVAQAGIIEFAAGDASDKLITIPLFDDTLAEGDESFVVSLGSPVGGAVWGEHAATSITIRENDLAVQFLGTRFRARENVGGSLISVQRLGRLTGTASVDYTTSDGTAQAGLDYLSQSGTLTFTDGETNKLIVVPIRDDLLSESDETVELALSHPTNGAMLGTNAAAELVIVDNDRAGTLDGSFNPGTGVCGDPGWGEVYAVAVQTDGRILVGGSFSRFNDVPCRGLVRLLPNGSVDPGFAVSLPGGSQFPLVTRLAPQPDGKVLLVAALDSLYNDNFLARVNLNGSFDNSFGFALAQETGGGQGRIEALLLQPDGRILIGGRFDTAKGVARTNLARFNPDGSLDAALATQVTMPLGSGQITALSSDGDGKILIGGLFDKVNGAGRHNLARLGASGVLDPAFDPPALTNANSDNSGVWLQTLAVQSNGKVMVGGSLSQFNGQTVPILVRLNSTGSLDTNFNAAVSNAGFDATPHPPNVSVVLCQPDNKLLVGGQFLRVNGILRKNLARLNPDGSLDLSFQSGEEEPNPYYYWAEEAVRALAVLPDGQIIVGGKFSAMDGQSRCGVARLNGIKLSLGGIARDADGRWRIRFTGTADAHYSVLASSNLIHWEIIGAAFEAAPGSFEFSDPGAANQPCRFYRLRSP